MPNDDSNLNSSDHDVLIEMRTEFRLFREEVRANNQLYSPLESRVTVLEKTQDRQETAISLTRWFGGVVGGILTLALAAYALFKH